MNLCWDTHAPLNNKSTWFLAEKGSFWSYAHLNRTKKGFKFTLCNGTVGEYGGSDAIHLDYVNTLEEAQDVVETLVRYRFENRG